MPSIAELRITRTVSGKVVDLTSNDTVEVIADVSITGKYTPAKLWAPMEDCYPEEFPDVEFVGATTIDRVEMYDAEGNYCMTLPAGTEIGHELTAEQTNLLEEQAYEEATA